MSQTNPTKIVIKNKNPGSLSTGMNTEVYLDGKLVKGCTFIKFEVKAKGLVKVLMEVYADIEVEVDTDPTVTVKPEIKRPGYPGLPET